jgi:hypothetical protein
MILSGRDELHNVYEEEKQNQVKGHKEGSAKWNQNLASNSEASVCCPSSYLFLGISFLCKEVK